MRPNGNVSLRLIARVIVDGRIRSSKPCSQAEFIRWGCCRFLIHNGFKHVSLHAQISNVERERKMKKYMVIVFSILLMMCFSSCNLKMNPPKTEKDSTDTVTIEGKEYKMAELDRLYPTVDGVGSTNAVWVMGKDYYQYKQSKYDCYVRYGTSAEPVLYFESSIFDEAFSYYNNEENFNFYCRLGNAFDEEERRIFAINNIDTSMFRQLLAFSEENGYDPFSFSHPTDDLIKVPLLSTENLSENEISFYKESKDEKFSSSRERFVLHENKLCLLYRYQLGEEAPRMLVRELPEEISDYFCSILEKCEELTTK